MSKPKEVNVDFAVLQFYDKVRSLLSDAGRYAHSFKLKQNLNDSATRFKVEHVFIRYYDGNMRKLDDEIHFRRRQCLKAIAEINRLCQRRNIYPVKDKEALTDLLLDETRRSEWKKIIKRLQKENLIVPLYAVEQEYRRKSNKAP